MRRILFVLLLFWSALLWGQADTVAKPEARMVPIETFPVNAEIVGVLQGTNNMAVLRIDRVDSNAMGLSVDDEILVEFYFSLEPVKETAMTGLKKGDHFSARLSARRDYRSGQWQYTAFHYKKRSTKVPAAPGDAESQK